MTRLPLTKMSLEEATLSSRVNPLGQPGRASDRRHLSYLQPRRPAPQFRQSVANDEKSCVSSRRPPPLRQQVRLMGGARVVIEIDVDGVSWVGLPRFAVP